eukprot:gene15407-18234_t
MVGALDAHLAEFEALWRPQLGDTLHPLINELVNDSDSWMYSRQTVITLITAFAVTPLSLLRTLNALTAASTSAVICLLFSTVAIAISAKDAVHDLGKGHLTEGVKMMKLDHQFIEALPILLFAFQCHIQVVQVFLELEACPSLLPWRRNDSQRWPVAQGSPGQSLLKTGGDAISRASSAENMLQPLVGLGMGDAEVLGYKQQKHRTSTMYFICAAALSICALAYCV